jgi:hypothetical protein
MAGKFAVKANGEASGFSVVWRWNERKIKQRVDFGDGSIFFAWQDGGEYRQ